MHYAELEPFGIDEGDFHAAILNSTIAGVVGAKVDPIDFTLRRYVRDLADRDADDDDGSASVDRFDALTSEVH